jgi:beta-glucanase (GH16 family)
MSLFSIGLNAQSCYELVWSDEFNYTGLPDSTKWTHEVGGGGWGNNELQYYTNKRLENSRVEDGKLIIEARKEAYQGNQYTSARLITYPNGHSWKYGKFEARMKLPYGQGIWPAFWMLGRNFFEGTSWPGCGEIDIMEMVGGDGTTGQGDDDIVHGTVHWSDNGNHADYGGSKQLAEGIFNDDFHVFSITWDSKEIRWFLDGQQYHIIDITPSDLNEFQKEFFIILNLAVGGNWPGNPNSSTVFPQQLVVDYVRVYQLDVEPEIFGDTAVVAGASNLTYSVVESDSFNYNWTVPADVVILEGQGTHEITVDWGCDTGSVICELITECTDYVLTQKVSVDTLAISGKEFVAENETNLVYSIPLTRDATQSWTLPEGVGLNSPADSNAIIIDWIDSDDEISVKVTNYCGSDSASKDVMLIRQLPYPDPEQPHIIPGAISSVEFDMGGEGIAYHDVDSDNVGPGSRQDEGVDTEMNDGGENVGWIETGEWLEYTVQVEETGTYDVEVRVASPSSVGKFSLSFNGENETGEISVPATGGWSSFNSLLVRDLELEVTDTLLRVDIVNGGFNMGRLTFADSIANSIELTKVKDRLMVYPTLATSEVFVKNITKEHNYSICDMSGRIVKSGILLPESSVSVEDLQTGSYFLILDDNVNISVSGKFLKIE